jgi:hypothetical protein
MGFQMISWIYETSFASGLWSMRRETLDSPFQSGPPFFGVFYRLQSIVGILPDIEESLILVDRLIFSPGCVYNRL